MDLKKKYNKIQSLITLLQLIQRAIAHVIANYPDCVENKEKLVIHYCENLADLTDKDRQTIKEVLEEKEGV